MKKMSKKIFWVIEDYRDLYRKKDKIVDALTMHHHSGIETSKLISDLRQVQKDIDGMLNTEITYVLPDDKEK